jgi:hypothetical protein
LNVTDIATLKDLLAEIGAERRKLDKMLAALDDVTLIEPGVCGEWSVKDMIAHLLAWQQLFLGWYRAGQRGEVPKMPAEDLTWGQTDILNQRFYEQYREHSLAEVRSLFAASDREVLDVAQGMTAEELFTPEYYAWTKTWKLYRFVWSVTGAHYRWARTEIRKWQKSQG